MLNRKKLLYIYIISIIFLVGCSKTLNVKVNIVPKNSGDIIGVGEYTKGENISLEAKPKNDYIFVGWEKDNKIVEDKKKFSFIIKSDKNLVAKFDKRKIKIEVKTNDSKMGDAKGSGKYIKDSELTLKAKPNENFEFIGWFNESNELISNKLSFRILTDKNKKYIAKFKPIKFSIDLNKNIDKGELSGEGKYKKDKKVTISAKKLNDYRFLYWKDKNGDIFSKNNTQMINISKDLNLKAIYEKKNLYLGYSKEEIRDSIFGLYASTYQTADGEYENFVDVSENINEEIKNGEHFITLRPDNLDVNLKNNLEIKKINIIDNEIIVKFRIRLPKIKNNNKEKLKADLKRNLPDINEFYSNYFEYNSNEYKIYEKEIKLKVIDNKLVVTDFENFDYLFSEYQKLYEKEIVDNINEITLEIENSVIEKTIIKYDGEIYKGKFNSKIFDHENLYSKINFKFKNGTKLNFEKLYFNLKKEFGNTLVADHLLFDDLLIIRDNISDKIVISLTFLRGMSPNTIIINLDGKKDYRFSEGIGYSIIENSLKFSKNKNYISYKLGYPSEGNLEVLNLKNMNRIKIIELLEDEISNQKGNPIFKNEKWIKDNNIEFELYLKINEAASQKEKILNKGKFRYNINTQKISRIIEDIEEYRSLDIESRKELVDLIDSTIASVNKEVADEMIYDLLMDKTDYKNKLEIYFNNISKKELNKKVGKAGHLAKEDYPNEFYNNYGLYHNEKQLVLDYIKNIKFKEKLDKYFNDFYGFKMTYGGYISQIDYFEINDEYNKYLSDDFNNYLDLKMKELSNPISADSALLLSPDELKNRLIDYEIFMKKSDNIKLKKDIKKLYLRCVKEMFNPNFYYDSYLNKHYQATFKYRMALDNLIKNAKVEVTSMAAKEMFEFIYSKKDFILRTYSDNTEMKKNYNNIKSKVLEEINEKYFNSN